MIGGMGTAPGHAPYLPEPTGPSPVGTTSLYLKDVSRPDPWAAGVDARELMVSLWYPATSPDGPRAPYMTPAESELQLTSRDITGVPPDVLSTTRTNAVSDATPAGGQRALPLVVLSPGFTNARSVLTGLAEDLASHGYVVAGIDHTYESFGTSFPDGRVTTAVARETRRREHGILGEGAGRPGRRCLLRARRADRCRPGLARRRADRPVPDRDGRPLHRRRGRHRRHGG